MVSTDPPRIEIDEPRGAPRLLSSIESSVLRYPLLFVATFVLIYGYKTEDFHDFEQLTWNPFVTHPLITRQFLHSSPLTLFIGWPLTRVIGAHASYAIICSGGFVLLLIALRLYLNRIPAEHRRVILFVAFSTPILLVLSRWIGKNDPYLLGLFLLLLTYRRNALLSAAFSLLLVLSHRELGIVMLAGDALLRRNARPPIISGAIIGFGLVSLYLASLTVPPFSRLQLAISYLGQGTAGLEYNLFAHLLLPFGWFWIFIFARGRTPDFPRVAGVLLMCFAINLDGADYTRDFILCAFPLVIYTAEKVAMAPNLAGLIAKRPFPLAFLVQMQIESFDQVRDSSWPTKLAPLLHHLWHPVP